MTVSNPEAPATYKQKGYLGSVLGVAPKELKRVSKGLASDLIETIELFKIEADDKSRNLQSNGKTPFTEAKVTFIAGEQGSGKSVTAVARIADAYDNKCVELWCEKYLKKKVKSKSYNRDTRIAVIILNGIKKKIHIPEKYDLQEPMRVKNYEDCPMRIFSNIHLYGIVYKFVPSYRHIVAWLKRGIIKDCYLLMDEYQQGGNARESMSSVGRELTKQNQQFRKGQMYVFIITPMDRLADWSARLVPTERIDAESFDKKTGMVTIKIRRKGVKGVREVIYNSKYYRRFYWTNERINN
jgi:hypothetical protein